MQYDAPVSGSEVLQHLDQNPSISDGTLAAFNAILDLDSNEAVSVGLYDGENLTHPEGDLPDLVVVKPDAGDGESAEIDIPDEVEQNAKGYVFETDADVIVTFNTVERVIVMGTGNDLVTVEGDRNTTLEGADGDDTLITSGGDDSVLGGDGNDSIDTGAGNDTVDGGAGRDTIVAGEGADLINGGDDYDVVQLTGSITDWEISTTEEGQLVLTSVDNPDDSATLTDVEFVELSEGSIAITDNETDANTLRLYEGLLGRAAEQGGAEYWLGDVNSEGRTVQDIANAFMHTEEYAEVMGNVTDLEFVTALYDNALGRTATEDEAMYWVGNLEDGQDRAAVAVNIIGSPEAAEHIASVQILDGMV